MGNFDAGRYTGPVAGNEPKISKAGVYHFALYFYLNVVLPD